MRQLFYLSVAVIGNALGTALMYHTDLGMTAWGSSSLNVGRFFDLPIGTSFLILSIIFYAVALFLNKEIQYKAMVYSFLFLASFSYLTNLFELWVPSFITYHISVRMMINVFGLLILLFSIALHLRINVAVHPMDVYLQSMQIKMNSVKIGSYLAYLSAFMVAIIFGLLSGEIKGIGFGTINTILFGGFILDYFDRFFAKFEVK